MLAMVMKIGAARKPKGKPLKIAFDTDAFRVRVGTPVHLPDRATRATLAPTAKLSDKALRAALASALAKKVRRFAALQARLYAQSSQALLLVFQGMDAAGKDSTIKHVTSGVNPQGFRVTNFSRPSSMELQHSWLQRHWPPLPEQGRIGIFNRSHYEEAVTLRVHPEWLAHRKIPNKSVDEAFWMQRLRDIAAFEAHLARNGTHVVKFFLNVSKAEQKRRLMERLDDPAKNWKFDPSDLVARARWDDYHRAYELAFVHTSTTYAPWYIIPADHKPTMRLIVATVVVEALAKMAPRFPEPDKRLRAEIAKAKSSLGAETARET